MVLGSVLDWFLDRLTRLDCVLDGLNWFVDGLTRHDCVLDGLSWLLDGLTRWTGF